MDAVLKGDIAMQTEHEAFYLLGDDTYTLRESTSLIQGYHYSYAVFQLIKILGNRSRE